MPRRPLNLVLSLACSLAGTGCATLQGLDKKVQPGGTLPAELVARGEPGPAVLPTLGPPPPIPEPMTLPPRLAAPAPVTIPIPAPTPVPKPVPVKPPATAATPPKPRADPGVLLAKAAPEPTAEPEPPLPVAPKALAPKPMPRPKPPGRVVATVGDEVVTLPELTAAVKARLAELEKADAGSLGRRQVIALAKGVLKGLVARSLVEQEARERLGADYERVVSELQARWERNESRLVQAKEDVSNEADLRRVLARRQTTPEAIRDEFLIRSLAQEVLDRRGSAMSLEAYLDDLARRRPVQTVMTPAELAAEGKREAEKR